MKAVCRPWLGFCAAAVLAALPGRSGAQQWFEYVSRADHFSVNFPGDPEVTEISYASEFDATFPARVFAASVAGGRYSVTVVDFTDAEAIHAQMEKTEAATSTATWINDQRASVARAAREFRQRGGEVTYDAWSHIDRVEGHQLQMTNADRSRTFAGIYLHGSASRLYVLEATVPAGAPPPGQFQQSLRFLDDGGQRIRYRLSPDGCSVVAR